MRWALRSLRDDHRRMTDRNRMKLHHEILLLEQELHQPRPLVSNTGKDQSLTTTQVYTKASNECDVNLNTPCNFQHKPNGINQDRAALVCFGPHSPSSV